MVNRINPEDYMKYSPQTVDNSFVQASPSVLPANGDNNNRLNPNLVLVAIVVLGIIGILAIVYMSRSNEKKCECKGDK